MILKGFLPKTREAGGVVREAMPRKVGIWLAFLCKVEQVGLDALKNGGANLHAVHSRRDCFGLAAA